MKYLIFNAAVVAALAYIFVGDGDLDLNKVTEPVSKAIDHFAKVEPTEAPAKPISTPIVVKSKREELTEQEKFILYGEQQPKQVEKPVVTSPVPVPPKEVKVAAVAAPALPTAIEVPVLQVKKPVTQSEPIHTQVPDDDAAEEIAAVPVDQVERRKNLRRMVADMERIFAEKLTQ